jgi:hypothetical protein
MSRPDSTFGHTKAPAVRQGLVWFRGNLNVSFAIVRVIGVKPAELTVHSVLADFAPVSKLMLIATDE